MYNIPEIFRISVTTVKSSVLIYGQKAISQNQFLIGHPVDYYVIQFCLPKPTKLLFGCCTKCECTVVVYNFQYIIFQNLKNISNETHCGLLR